jgi:hypothetical protein
MDVTKFEQQFSWLKTYAHEVREIAETLEEESDFFMRRAVQAMKAKGPPEARSVLEAVRRTVEGLKGKVEDLERAYRSVAQLLG